MTCHRFLIGEWGVDIVFAEADAMAVEELLPSFRHFRAADAEAATLLTMTVDNAAKPVPRHFRQHVRDFDTGNGVTVVDRLADGGYQFVIRDTAGGDCALLVTDARFRQCRCALAGTGDMRRYGLNCALMLAYAFAGAFCGTLLIHASVVRHHGRAVAFTAKSGTGKSTQSANWLSTVPDCDLMNDDNPVVRLQDGRVTLYGSPWSGKTPCYRQTHAPLGAVVQIVRDTANTCQCLPPLQAFGTLLASCSTMKWERELYACLCETVSDVVAATPFYALRCTAEPQSALVCHSAVMPDA